MSAPLDNRPLPDVDADEPKKRAAFAGQWRTPPLPVFPTSVVATSDHAKSLIASENSVAGSSSSSSHNNTASGGSLGLASSDVPLSTEDYQKALQEAYRRGAEAATARALAQGSASPAFLPTAASCPDFQQHDAQQQLTDSSMQLLPPSALSSEQQQPSNKNMYATTAPSASTGNLNPSMPPPPMMLHNNTGATATAAGSPIISSVAAATNAASPMQQRMAPAASSPSMYQYQQRSMSLPDMTSYGAKQEEEKRQKRLARNRASARLRRLRKKNLVDAYETEVGILEKTLEQLQVHEWGTLDNPRALVEALSMDRGQQVLTTEERKQTATDILEQQLEYVGMLEEMMQEQYVLHQLQHDPALEQELRSVMGLTDQQVQQLAGTATGWQDEWDALQTVKTSLQAMKDNNWLWNEGCMAVAEEFMGLLHKNQISKLLLWADHNVEAIDELDVVNAPSQIAQGPVFHFGINSNPEGLLDEERTQAD